MFLLVGWLEIASMSTSNCIYIRVALEVGDSAIIKLLVTGSTGAS